VEVAPDAAHVLGRRDLAVLIDSASDYNAGGSTYDDVWVLANGKLLPVSEPAGHLADDRARAAGYSTTYDYADFFSLAPDGKHIAFLVIPPGIEGGPNSDLFVSRSDGTGIRQIRGVEISPFSDVSTPSWDHSRTFLVSIDTTRSSIFRVSGTHPGHLVMLTPRNSRYDEWRPIVSPNGRQIAFLRSAAPASGGGIDPFDESRKLVYMMQTDGRAPVRLPLPARDYHDLWWCGSSSATLCTDVYSPESGAPCSSSEDVCTAVALRNTFEIAVNTGRVIRKRHWLAGLYTLLSTDPLFAITTRKASRGWEVLGGPVNTAGKARFSALLVAPDAKSNPFHAFSVSCC
jgi:hypothetical protein